MKEQEGQWGGNNLCKLAGHQHGTAPCALGNDVIAHIYLPSQVASTVRPRNTPHCPLRVLSQRPVTRCVAGRQPPSLKRHRIVGRFLEARLTERLCLSVCCVAMLFPQRSKKMIASILASACLPPASNHVFRQVAEGSGSSSGFAPRGLFGCTRVRAGLIGSMRGRKLSCSPLVWLLGCLRRHVDFVGTADGSLSSLTRDGAERLLGMLQLSEPTRVD